MAHTKLYGICEAKCMVEVISKEAQEATDGQQDQRMTAIETKNTQQDSRLTAIETKNTQQDTAINGKEPIWKDVSNVTVSNWVANTYTTQKEVKKFNYMAVVSVPGITDRTMVHVDFADAQSLSGDYCSKCIVGPGSVTIFSKLNTRIVIDRIIGKV